MKIERVLRFTALGASLVLVAIACSNANGELEEAPDAPDATPSVPLPTEDSAAPDAPDAGSDASLDADVTQPKRTCTDEGWCHTVVPDDQTLRSVWGDGQGTVWTVSEKGNILRWDGAAWVQSHAAGVPLYAIWGSSPTDLWAGGGATSTGTALPGTLLHGTGTSASTITWTAVPAPVTVRSIWGTSANDVWAAASMANRVYNTDPSYLLHYSGAPTSGDADAGTGWEIDPGSSAFPAHFEKVWGTSGDDVWVSGRVRPNSWTTTGQVLHRRPDGAGGFTWKLEQPTTSNSAGADTFGFSVSPTLTFLVAFSTDSSTRAYWHTGVSNDNGASFTWTQHAASETGFADGALSTLWSKGPDDIWMAGQKGRLRHWDGVQWRVAAVAVDDVMPVQNAVHAIWGTGPDDLWVVGVDLALHKVAPSKM
jgi:hypothetical protein